VATVAALAEEVSRKALCTELPALVVGPVAYPQRNVAERVSSIHECPRGGLLENRRSSTPEEEKPEHRPDEGHHYKKGRHKEFYHSHAPTVTKQKTRRL
jgi:hypothetical protein